MWQDREMSRRVVWTYEAWWRKIGVFARRYKGIPRRTAALPKSSMAGQLSLPLIPRCVVMSDGCCACGCRTRRGLRRRKCVQDCLKDGRFECFVKCFVDSLEIGFVDDWGGEDPAGCSCRFCVQLKFRVGKSFNIEFGFRVQRLLALVGWLPQMMVRNQLKEFSAPRIFRV